MQLIISQDNDGRRVDRILRTIWRDVPLGTIMKAIRTGAVRLDGKKTKPEAHAAEGQELFVPFGERESSTEQRTPDKQIKRPQKRVPAIPTVYKDDFLWIVNKPAGLLTQPDVKGGDALITRALDELHWIRRDFAPATVQRLDRNTSGALIIALNGNSMRILSELIRERKIRKIYHAVVCGIAEEAGRIDFPLYKDSAANTVKVDTRGQEALTLYKRLAVFDACSLVEAELVTGRPHQARVHLAAIGHPIIGDTKYGDGQGTKRPLLHAKRIIFPDDARLPEAIRSKEFDADVPADMRKYEVFNNEM